MKAPTLPGVPVWLDASVAHRIALAAVLLLALLARASVVTWSDPWGPHHPDEHILPLEALALWEGITPREVGAGPPRRRDWH